MTMMMLLLMLTTMLLLLMMMMFMMMMVMILLDCYYCGFSIQTNTVRNHTSKLNKKRSKKLPYTEQASIAL